MAQLYPGDYAALRTLWYSTPGTRAFEKLQAIRALTVEVSPAVPAIADPPTPEVPAVMKSWWELNGFAGPVDWPQLLEAGLWQEPPPGTPPEDT